MGFCNCSMLCCVLLCVHSSFAIISMGKRELVALLLSYWCLVIVVWLFLTKPQVSLQFVIVVFPDHTHLLFILHRTTYTSPYLAIPFSFQQVHITSIFIYIFSSNFMKVQIIGSHLLYVFCLNTRIFLSLNPKIMPSLYNQ